MIYKNNNCPVFFACKDGTFSTNNKRGACRGHGGLKYKKEDLLESQIENYFYKEYHIADLLRSTKFDPESYKRFGDENFVKEKFMFLKKGGSLIDQDAQELTELIGVKVTPQDIVDAINLSSTPRSYMHYLKEETKDIMEREKKQSGVFGDNAFYFYGKGVFSKDKKFDFEAKTEEKESKPKKPEPRPIGFKQNIAPKPEKSANVIMFPKPEKKQTQAKLEYKYKVFSDMIKPKHITIEYSEGIKTSLLPATFPTFEKANEFLRNNIDIRYVDGKDRSGYAKTGFKILWNDDETYEGRVDIDEYVNNPFRTNNVIGCHIQRFWENALKRAGEGEFTGYSAEELIDVQKFLQTYNLGECEKFPSIYNEYSQTKKQDKENVIVFPKPEVTPTKSTFKVLSSDIEKYFVLSDYVHTKTGKKLVLASPIKKYNADLFRLIRSEAKKIGGYYSTFAKGFLFDDLNKDVEAFLKTNPESTTTKTISSKGKKSNKSKPFYPYTLADFTNNEIDEYYENGKKVIDLIISANTDKEVIAYLENPVFWKSYCVYSIIENDKINKMPENVESLYRCHNSMLYSKHLQYRHKAKKHIIKKMVLAKFPEYIQSVTIREDHYSSYTLTCKIKKGLTLFEKTREKLYKDISYVADLLNYDCSNPQIDYYRVGYYLSTNLIDA